MRTTPSLAVGTLLAACLPMYVTYLEPSAPGANVRRATACHGTRETYRTVLEFEQEGLYLLLDSREMRYAEDGLLLILRWKTTSDFAGRLTAGSAYARLDIPGQGRSHLLELSRGQDVLLDADTQTGKTGPMALPLAGTGAYWFSYGQAGFAAGRAVLTLPELRVDERPVSVPPIELRVRRTVAIEFNC